MRAKDLMIGDWVYYYREEYDQEYTQITREDMYEMCCLPDGEDDRYRPLPLSMEMLEDNHLSLGDNILSVVAETQYYKIENAICIRKTTEIIGNKPPVDVWHISIRCDELEMYSGGHITIDLLYVHEFQHVLRIISLADLADNFKVNTK